MQNGHLVAPLTQEMSQIGDAATAVSLDALFKVDGPANVVLASREVQTVDDVVALLYGEQGRLRHVDLMGSWAHGRSVAAGCDIEGAATLGELHGRTGSVGNAKLCDMRNTKNESAYLSAYRSRHGSEDGEQHCDGADKGQVA